MNGIDSHVKYSSSSFPKYYINTDQPTSYCNVHLRLINYKDWTVISYVLATLSNSLAQ